MPLISAGLLMCKTSPELQFFLIHPGGPYFKNKNEGVWSIPKGLQIEGENLQETAIREFVEETGIIPAGPYEFLETVKMKSGKTIHAWSFIGEWNPDDGIICNTFPLEWPPHSKKIIQVPEADRAAWYTHEEALKYIHPSQKEFIEKARQIYSSY